MTFFIHNFGCQMNEHDVAKMTMLLREQGLEEARDAASAAVVVINTCCVREKAEQKFLSLAGRLKTLKKRKGTIIGVTGCIAQLEKGAIAERLPFIDFALGPQAIHRIAEAVARASRREVLLDFDEDGSATGALAVTPGNIRKAPAAFVTIMKGCDNFCSYCVVPYVRGREVSRPSAAVLAEIEALALEGVKEVTLLGQNVNSYNRGAADLSFPELLERVDGIDGIERIRFVTSHPKDLSPELVGCFGRLGKLCESIHLPFQAGSDRVLVRMNRRYTVEEYREKVLRLRERCPAIAITADCIVGFPGEGEEDFAGTLGLAGEIRFDGIFSFAYSPRKRTAALSLDGEVAREVALERLGRLQRAQKEITLEKNRAEEGAVREVLVEGVSRNSEEDVTGRTRTNKVVNFKGGRHLVGRTVDVRIVSGYANSLRGEMTG